MTPIKNCPNCQVPPHLHPDKMDGFLAAARTCPLSKRAAEAAIAMAAAQIYANLVTK